MGVQLPLLLGAAGLALAGPYPRDDLHDFGFSYLMPRGCSSYCGADNQFCCGQGQVCTTMHGDIATCVAGGGGGGGGAYADYTTTWTETFTSTHYTNWAPAPATTAGVQCVPQNDQQEACGTVCCAGWQTCAYQGQCSAKPGYDEPTAVVVTTNGVATTQYSAPYRVTGTTVIVTSGSRTATETGTNTASSTTSTSTSDSDTVGSSSSSSSDDHGGLSGGAIAGIVIGTLAGIALLILLCFCCIARGLWHAIFGRKDHHKERDRTEIYEERYSRHGSRVPSAYSRKDRHSGWFGGGGRPSSAADRREKKKDGGKFWLGLAGGAATLLALLNLRKDKKPKKAASSRYSESYYSYSDATTPSSVSSGGRTQRSRRTRDSRGSRDNRSYYTRSSRR